MNRYFLKKLLKINQCFRKMAINVKINIGLGLKEIQQKTVSSALLRDYFIPNSRETIKGIVFWLKSEIFQDWTL